MSSNCCLCEANIERRHLLKGWHNKQLLFSTAFCLSGNTVVSKHDQNQLLCNKTCCLFAGSMVIGEKQCLAIGHN